MVPAIPIDTLGAGGQIFQRHRADAVCVGATADAGSDLRFDHDRKRTQYDRDVVCHAVVADDDRAGKTVQSSGSDVYVSAADVSGAGVCLLNGRCGNDVAVRHDVAAVL